MAKDIVKPVPEKQPFTRYQTFVIAVIALLQFTIIVDFMVISPLSDILMKELTIDPAHFGLVVSAYAISAGISGILAAGFADKFDRKKLLMFFYAGFVVGTAMCALANTYEALLIARIVTGIFGGVIGSIGMAIVTDLFTMQQRGRVMGFVQMAFGASQVLGIPIGLYLATHYSWHLAFWMIVGFSAVLGIAIAIYLQPVKEHLKIRSERNPLQHLGKTVGNRQYLLGFLGTMTLATGGFMMMPFSAAYNINNLGITQSQLITLYTCTGIFSFLSGALIGRLSDKVDKYLLFCIGSAISIVMVLIYVHLGHHTPLPVLITVSAVMFIGIMSRMVPATTLASAIPQAQDRGAYMAINSSVQQISGGIAAAIAGMIIVKNPDKSLTHFDWVGYVTIACMVLGVVIMYFVNRMVQRKLGVKPAVKPIGEALAT